MTAELIRKTPFADWKDPDAWMEAMKGPKWEAVLQEEATNANKLFQHPAVQRRIGVFRGFLDTAKALHGAATKPFDVGPFEIVVQMDMFKQWRWKGISTIHDAHDCLPHRDAMLCTKDIADGAEQFELQVWLNKSQIKPTWTLRNVGPEIGALDTTLFYLNTRKRLQYYQLWRCDWKTGANKELLFEVPSDQVNLTLERQSDGRLFLLAENAQDLTVFELTPSGSLLSRKEYKVPPKSWILPLLSYGVDFLWPKRGFLITKTMGQKTLWKCGPSKQPQKLFSIPAGTIQFDPWAVWEGRMPCTVRISEPNKGIALYTLTADGTLTLQAPVVPTPLSTERFEGRSQDGTAVFGCLTKMIDTKPKALLVIGYGAYGLPTAIGSVMQRWAPLVKRGWAIAHTFLRGGGDHTEAWAKEGRRAGRAKTVDDFLALVFAAQQETGVPPSKTVIYGRSAGGLLVGESLNRNPNGEAFSAIYTEVPYVDELRTTTNPSLPLTTLEYNEFGAPALRLEDFLFVARTSPADSATVLSTPEVLVIARTAEHDSQVYTYEPVKWVRRLRANAPDGAPKVCVVERGQGHFTPPDLAAQQAALDLAVLDAWVDQDLVEEK
jgi:dienelactone hydrolase